MNSREAEKQYNLRKWAQIIKEWTGLKAIIYQKISTTIGRDG